MVLVGHEASSFEVIRSCMRCTRGEDPEEDQVACVFCSAAGSCSKLSCLHCDKQIPFCLATGESVCTTVLPLRMGTSQWAICIAVSAQHRSCPLAALIPTRCTAPVPYLVGLCGACQVNAVDWAMTLPFVMAARQADVIGRLGRVSRMQVPCKWSAVCAHAGSTTAMPSVRSRSERVRYHKKIGRVWERLRMKSEYCPLPKLWHLLSSNQRAHCGTLWASPVGSRKLRGCMEKLTNDDVMLWQSCASQLHRICSLQTVKHLSNVQTHFGSILVAPEHLPKA